MVAKRAKSRDRDEPNIEKEKVIKSTKEETPKKNENGVEFEDVYEDEFEEEQVVEESDAKNMDNDAVEQNQDYSAVFRQGIDELEEDEEMVYHSSAYAMLHRLNLEQSCLSFDFLQDDLGASRSKFPHSVSLVAGSQAEIPGENKLYLFHATHLHKTKRDDDDSSSVGSDSSEDSNGLDEDAQIFSKSVKHWGSVNRVKSMPQNAGIIATWSDSGKVYFYDLANHLKALHAPSFKSTHNLDAKSSKKTPNENAIPLYTFRGHSEEGYALNFSRVKSGSCVTGSCDASIFTHSITPEGKVVSAANPFSTHTDSVEDLAFSPSEATVFSSCSVDQTVKIFDTRSPKMSHMISFKAHDSDVNVISWNEQVKYLLASGSDAGDFKVWDLRMLKPNEADVTCESVGFFSHHQKPITSIKWDPNDDSVLSVSCDDNSISVWDLSLEDDDVSELTTGMNAMKLRDRAGDEIKLPPQLLFLHQGVEQPKEIGFHAQVPGLIGSTTLDSIHLFICEPLQQSRNKK